MLVGTLAEAVEAPEVLVGMLAEALVGTLVAVVEVLVGTLVLEQVDQTLVVVVAIVVDQVDLVVVVIGQMKQ